MQCTFLIILKIWAGKITWFILIALYIEIKGRKRGGEGREGKGSEWGKGRETYKHTVRHFLQFSAAKSNHFFSEKKMYFERKFGKEWLLDKCATLKVKSLISCYEASMDGLWIEQYMWPVICCSSNIHQPIIRRGWDNTKTFIPSPGFSRNSGTELRPEPALLLHDTSI